MEHPQDIGKPAAETRDRQPSSARLLIFILINGILFNLALLIIHRHIIPPSQNSLQESTLRATQLFFQGIQGKDSLGAMLPAIHLLENNPRAAVYQSIFFEDHTKFQYPLTSLLPYYALQQAGASDASLFFLTKVVTWLSVCVTILLTIRIAFVLDLSGKRNRQQAAMTMITVGIAGLLFYPLMRGFNLGQIQTLLTLGFTIALSLWMNGRERSAGAVMGLMILVKPQYALFLIWALLRRKFGAFIACASCAATGFLISCIAFGLRNNLDYLQVLRTISQHGESFFSNQSMNGLLNRLMLNGNDMVWEAKSFAPYNPIVYWGTVLSSLVILGLALFWRWGAQNKGSVADFACIILAATLASPVAWEHHFAILLPIVVWLWFGKMTQQQNSSRWSAALLGFAYVLIGNNITPMAALASTPILNIFQSYLYFGALVVMFLLLRSADWTDVDWPKSAAPGIAP